MHHNQAFQSDNKGSCGPMGRRGFGGPWDRGKFARFWGRGPAASGFSQPPVNIEETETDYVISLFAAGLLKEQVTLTVKDDVLTIAYPGANADTAPSANPETTHAGNYTYQEHSQTSFKRSFKLNDKVVTEHITASYADGILKVILPKNPATNKPVQSIQVG